MYTGGYTGVIGTISAFFIFRRCLILAKTQIYEIAVSVSSPIAMKAQITPHCYHQPMSTGRKGKDIERERTCSIQARLKFIFLSKYCNC